MIVAISQPEHFPYGGFFSKMSSCDVFVLLDDVQFSGPRSFQNRNRFLNGAGRQEWFGVPVARGSYFSLLKDVLPAEDYGWRRKVLKTLHQRYKVDFTDIYDKPRLCEINLASIQYLANLMRISKPIVLSSELKCSGTKSEKLANICRTLGAKTYLSGPGGATYLDHTVFDNLKVDYHTPQPGSMMTSLEYLRT